MSPLTLLDHSNIVNEAINYAVKEVNLGQIKPANLESLDMFQDDPDCKGEPKIGVNYFDARTALEIGEYIVLTDQLDNTTPQKYLFKGKFGFATFLSDDEIDYILPMTHFQKFCNQVEAINITRAKQFGGINRDLFSVFGERIHGSIGSRLYKVALTVLSKVAKSKMEVLETESSPNNRLIFRQVFYFVEEKLSDIKLHTKSLTRVLPQDIETGYDYTFVKDGKFLYNRRILDIDTGKKRLKTQYHDYHRNEDISKWVDYTDDDIFYFAVQVNQIKEETHKLALTLIHKLVQGLSLRFAKELKGE